MTITVDGLFSGLDTTAIIDALVGVQAGNRNIMQAQLDRERQQSAAVSDLMSRLNDLSDAATTLQDTASAGYTASFPEGMGYTAEAGAGAVAGTYLVDITSLATSEMEVSQGFTDQTSNGVVSQGTLDVTIGGVTTTVTVDGTNDSLQELANSIDEVDGVQAYVLNNGGSTPYQLVVQSEDTGAANAITIDTSGLTGGGTVPTFSEAQTGTDAALTVNGLSIASGSNSVTAIPGLTIDLQDAGLGASTIEVEIDQTALEEQLQTFVDSYNEVVNFYSVRNTFNAETEVRGAFFGDGTSRRVLDRIGTMVSSAYTTDSALTILAQVGIETEQTGTLNLDTVDLSDALDEDFDAVIEFLTSDTGPLALLATEIDDVFVDSVDGVLDSRKESLERSIQDLEDQIADEDLRLEEQADLLRGQFTRLEQALAELQSTSSFIGNLLPTPTS